MRIAINAAGYEEGEGLLPLLKLTADQRKDDQFIVFSDKPINSFSTISTEVIGSPVNSLLAKRWWLDVKLPAALKAFKPDLLITLNSDISLRTNLSQLFFLTETLFLHSPKSLSSAELLFRKFYLPKYLKKAKAIITPSEYIKKEVTNNFNTSADKIFVIKSIIDNAYQSLAWQQQQQVKDGYADGREYFLFTGGFDPMYDLISVLKAFSQFKKWQRSNMKLIVTGDTSNLQTAEKLQTYKFRDDVIVLNNTPPEQKARLMAAAYAVIHTPVYDASAITVMEAMQCGTPVITVKIGAIPEIAGEAVLYADPASDEMIAAQMIKLHKDESLKAQLAETGKLQAEKYSSDNAVEKLWQLIADAVAG